LSRESAKKALKVHLNQKKRYVFHPTPLVRSLFHSIATVI
jgi:hypothetical protein